MTDNLPVGEDHILVALHDCASFPDFPLGLVRHLERPVPHVVEDARHQHAEHGGDAQRAGHARAPEGDHRTDAGIRGEAVGLGPVAVRQDVEDVRAAHAGRVVDGRLREPALVQVHEPVRGQLLHLGLRAEGQRLGRAGLDAGRLEPDRDPVGAERALVDAAVLLADAGDVERAPGDAVAAPDAAVLLEVDDPVGVLDDRARAPGRP